MASKDIGLGNLDSLERGEGVAQIFGGYTGKTIAEGFINLRFSGIRDMAKKLQELAARVGEPKALENACRAGAKIIEKGYAQRVPDVTGNLKKSIRTRTKSYPQSGGVIAITGPLQTGNKGATERNGSGNIAWLYEFGSGRRKPGTQGRRTYINVHQSINKRMHRHSSANDEQFERMGRGYYFLMSSYDEPTRQARQGSGYPHDFGYTDGRQHPITLHPGETYAPMPASHAMQRTIDQEQQAVFNTLKSAIQNSISRLGG